MNSFSRKFLLAFPLLFLVLNACQRRANKWNPGEAFKTQIIIGKSTGTEFKEVELHGVFDKSTLTGTVADFYFSPSNDQDGNLIGDRALTRFIEDDGVFIPADQKTLQMVTIYYHLQELKNLELQSSGTTESLLSWPRKVAVSVKVMNAPDLRYDNAFYNAITDTLYFVPYKDEEFPIPLNPGIIAHELFHAYFSKQVLNPLLAQDQLPKNLSANASEMESVTDLYNLFVMKIINEGLADVWGWIYSQDPDFVALSLTKAGDARNLEKGNNMWSSRVANKQVLLNELRLSVKACQEDSSNCGSPNPYSNGTLLARGFKAFATKRMESQKMSAETVKQEMALKVLSLLQKIQSSFAEQKTIDIDQVLSLWQKEFTDLSNDECLVLKETASASGVITCGSSDPSSLQ